MLVVFIVVASYQCKGQETNTKENYTYKTGSFDGIGKWYMNREIAHVMGFQGMSWLERPEREKEENTTKLIDNMNISKSDVIADIGAGSGYHVFKMAPVASDGHIYAVDIQDEMLAELRRKKVEAGLRNITIVKGSENSVNLTKNSIDKILIVDVYHELSHPFEVGTSIYEALKPDGKLFLIEYRAEDQNVPIKKLHKMSEAQAIKEMSAIGFKLEANIDNLPWQHCMVFVKE